MQSNGLVLGVEMHELESIKLVGVIMLTLAWASFLPRVYVRALLIRDVGWDDWWMLLTMVLFTGYFTCVWIGTNAIIEITDGNLKYFILALMRVRDTAILYALASSCLKFSAVFYLRRFHLPRWQSVGLISAATLYFVIAVVAMVVNITECHSVSDIAYAMSNFFNGKCTPWSQVAPIIYIAAIANCLVDWLIVLAPVHLIIRSAMDQRSKLAATALIALGSLGGICSIVRIAYVHGLNLEVAAFPPSGIGHATMVELGICTTASCLATLRPLFFAARNALHPTTSPDSRTGASAPAPDGPEGHMRELDRGHRAFGTIHLVRGKGILANPGAKTGLSTVTSAIFRRIRDEDFALFAPGMSTTGTGTGLHGGGRRDHYGSSSRLDTLGTRSSTNSGLDAWDVRSYEAGASEHRHGSLAVGEQDAARDAVDIEKGKDPDSHRLSVRSFELASR